MAAMLHRNKAHLLGGDPHMSSQAAINSRGINNQVDINNQGINNRVGINSQGTNNRGINNRVGINNRGINKVAMDSSRPMARLQESAHLVLAQ